MAIFSYKAYNSQGQLYRSRCEASSLFEAKRNLVDQGVRLFHIEQNKTSQSKKVTKTTVLQFTQELTQLIEAGLPLFESINLLKAQFSKDPIGEVLYSISETLESGSPFSKALAQFPDCFSTLYCSLIRIGEESGHLDHSLNKIIEDYQRQTKLQKKVKSTLLYPCILLFFCTALIHLMILYIVPSLENLFDSNQGHPFTQLVIAFSHHMKKWEVYYLLAGAGVAIFIYLKIKDPKWKPHLDRLLLKLPLFNTFLLDLSFSKFCSTMTMLLKGGIPLLESLTLSRQLLSNGELCTLLDELIEKIQEGEKLSLELEKKPLFPPIFSRIIRIGEGSGELSKSFERLSIIYEEEVEKKLSKLMTLLSPLILLIMGVIIGAVMLGILIPLTDINSIAL